jgi:hypothetical protein
MSKGPQIEIGTAEYRGYSEVELRAGRREVERVVPPAGEAYAFYVQRWAKRVTVCVSPAGRSVRVWIDGVEIK